ncbi:tRNA (5-methylaminomethyl-2-thiouridylate)-methyltransferase [Caminicella sporogenes DSM 14501]|uniref:tRNA-specific 2-thiouridylase MnmA n=1 Tax=Caminicella sporogenes DSM 14501 TaxID=1121266 RepID=A0A1M6LRB4_9FIRM|nr:tRNA 2-thiouridine(34) synthase MnmA [Caminicella sporogenes]RKD27922.1 tRNA 2-thiouridine(34) synthase MnmA [Caminicella sporogenes]WIF94487.1 tRNA 2-thiouridine(34) synthase MnmA [Caminicella sporogenes]SHJ73723.1 tRNA (5-methylaminomethyl-2-thiouridylate)-methyltransferase [Caminicella sporogenes DSM 14501]
MTALDKNKVVVGMSGGVDSSVAAYLLKKQGYEVIGVMMKIWQEPSEEYIESEDGCCGLSAADDARRVANKIGIPFYVVNFKSVFKEKVINYFIDEYLKGRTPNPCIACNRYIKFEELLKKAHSLGAYYVATGHYARIIYDDEKKRYLIKKSSAEMKDQTYTLYNLKQEQLKHILMPLGEYTSKEEIRKIAEEIGLDVANKPDSQEICFVPDNDYGNFIEENIENKIEPGDFVDTKGNVLGKHKGIIHYTIGQRKGLGLSLGKPAYVINIIPEKNQVVIGENKDVFSFKLIAQDVNFISVDKLTKPLKVQAKIRYSAKPAEAVVKPLEKDKVIVEFENPQRAITPGQAVVFYDGDILVGGGIIEKAVK